VAETSALRPAEMPRFPASRSTRVTARAESREGVIPATPLATLPWNEGHRITPFQYWATGSWPYDILFFFVFLVLSPASANAVSGMRVWLHAPGMDPLPAVPVLANWALMEGCHKASTQKSIEATATKAFLSFFGLPYAKAAKPRICLFFVCFFGSTLREERDPFIETLAKSNAAPSPAKLFSWVVM